MLRQFQSVLKRDSLKKDLDDKYVVIFQNYALDLDAVQKIYEKHKHSPATPRNAPPVAGDIMWSRQLLRRIEEPMRKFAANEMIMRTKESKRTVKTYNTVAKALVAFETLWLRAWRKSIEDSKAGLQATLIVRHPETGNLLVNFDKEIMQLMRETKYLQRMGVEVPESAKMVLLQEEKFKHYYNQLSYALREYDRVVATAAPVCLGDARSALTRPREPVTTGDVLVDVDVHEHRRVLEPHPRRAGEGRGAHREDERRPREPRGGESETRRPDALRQPPRRAELHVRGVSLHAGALHQEADGADRRAQRRDRARRTATCATWL
jgi:hypothetical protein